MMDFVSDIMVEAISKVDSFEASSNEILKEKEENLCQDEKSISTDLKLTFHMHEDFSTNSPGGTSQSNSADETVPKTKDFDDDTIDLKESKNSGPLLVFHEHGMELIPAEERKSSLTQQPQDEQPDLENFLPIRRRSSMNTSSFKQNNQYGTEQNDQYGTEQNDQYGTEQNDQYGTEQNDQYGTDQNNQYGTEQNDQYWTEHNDQYGTEQNNQYGTEQNDQYGTEQNNQYGTEQNDQYGTEQNDQYGTEQNNQYGTEQNDQYGTEQNDQYGTEQNDQYGTEQNDQYGTEQNDQYGTEQNDQYGTEQNNQYGTEQNNQYGTEQNNQYGTEQNDQYGTEQNNQYGTECNDSEYLPTDKKKFRNAPGMHLFTDPMVLYKLLQCKSVEATPFEGRENVSTAISVFNKVLANQIENSKEVKSKNFLLDSQKLVVALGDKQCGQTYSCKRRQNGDKSYSKTDDQTVQRFSEDQDSIDVRSEQEFPKNSVCSGHLKNKSSKEKSESGFSVTYEKQTNWTERIISYDKILTYILGILILFTSLLPGGSASNSANRTPERKPSEPLKLSFKGKNCVWYRKHPGSDRSDLHELLAYSNSVSKNVTNKFAVESTTEECILIFENTTKEDLEKYCYFVNTDDNQSSCQRNTDADNGNFSEWSPWSTCREGIRNKTRNCIEGICQGDLKGSEKCNGEKGQNGLDTGVIICIIICSILIPVAIIVGIVCLYRKLRSNPPADHSEEVQTPLKPLVDQNGSTDHAVVSVVAEEGDR